MLYDGLVSSGIRRAKRPWLDSMHGPEIALSKMWGDLWESFKVMFSNVPVIVVGLKMVCYL